MHNRTCSKRLTFLTIVLLFSLFTRHQFSSVIQSCPTPCDPMNCSMPGLPVHHQLPEFTQTHIHRVSDAIQPSLHKQDETSFLGPVDKLLTSPSLSNEFPLCFVSSLGTCINTQTQLYLFLYFGCPVVIFDPLNTCQILLDNRIKMF